MLKVLIADDEKGICRLLQYLIDWTAYGMEIIRVVHTGMDALSSIRELHPDIVITWTGRRRGFPSWDAPATGRWLIRPF